jgi:hypothetical protein
MAAFGLTFSFSFIPFVYYLNTRHFTVNYLQHIFNICMYVYFRSFRRHKFDRNKTVYAFNLDTGLWQHVTERTE